MIVLADKVRDLLEKLRFENNSELNGKLIDVVYDFIKNYPTIINESNLSNDFCEGLEERLKRKLTEDELDEISGSGVIDELEDEMLGVINDKIMEYSEDMKWVFL